MSHSGFGQKLNLTRGTASGFIIIGMAVLLLGHFQQAIKLNGYALEVSHRVSRSAENNAASVVLSDGAEAVRLAGMLALHESNTARADQAFAAALEADATLINLIRAARPQAPELSARAYELYPTLPAVLAWRADALESTVPLQALDLYEKSAQLGQGDNITWEKLGLLAQRLEKNDVALDAFARACVLDPIRNGNCHNAARLSYSRSDWANVVHYFELGSLPEHPDDWVLLIKAARNLGRTTEADGYLSKAQDRNPADYATILRDTP